MTGTLLRIGWINFKRDRVVQALTFLLPILFFSIFAVVFGNQQNPTRKVRVAVVDEDRSAFSAKVVSALEAEGGLQVRTRTGTGADAPVLDRAGAEALVRSGGVPVAVVLPAGLGNSRKFWNDPGQGVPKVLLLADVSDPVAPQMVQGLLQKVSFTAAPELLATEGMAMFEKYGGPLTPAQQQSRDQWLLEMQKPPATAGAGSAAAAGPAMGFPTEIVNVMQPDQSDTSTIAFYAAGIGVMFLLFSAAGAGGTLLEEEESGTLGRLVESRAGMSGLLIGKWLFVMLMGCVQLTVMFVWGALVFGLPLLPHLPGFAVMTIFTAGAAAGFGLVLATISRTRAQLSGLSTIIILTMSAIGGSMFPRFLMSETMQQFGLVTFNAWALDGYLKVFWRNAPLIDLWPQVLVLGGLTVLFLLVSRRLARRWELA
jgi:ABC-2 type transport system permease protein